MLMSESPRLQLDHDVVFGISGRCNRCSSIRGVADRGRIPVAPGVSQQSVSPGTFTLLIEEFVFWPRTGYA